MPQRHDRGDGRILSRSPMGRCAMSVRPARLIRALFASASMLLSIGPASRAATAVYPVRQSANHRYLVDARGTPFMIVGDSPQALIGNATEAEAELYLADRQALGFNTIWVNLL